MSRKAIDTRYRVKLGTRAMRLRTLIVFGAAILCCIGLAGQILYLNKTKGDAYQKKMLSQQSYVSNAIPFKRGDIVDRNGNKLATSHKVYNLLLDPKEIRSKTEYTEATVSALERAFGVDEGTLRKILKANPTSRYYQMKDYKALEENQVKKFQALEEKDENIKGVWFEEEYKRTYPYSTVACDVIGFCADKDTGTWGIENQYNKELNGTYGRRYGYYDSELNLVQTVKAATNGYTVKSTIDVNVQGIMEQHIEKFMSETGAKNIGCILMNPKNGAIYAMGSDPVYDLNNPRDLTGIYTKEELNSMSQEDQLNALNALWRNYCISDAYEPGSTFKPITIAACLDEGVTNNGRYYTCDGGQQVADRYIKCVAYSAGGHGSITVKNSLMVSCNDVLMQLGAALGKTKFLDYVNQFGFGRKTGIDLPGEATGTIFNSETMHETELATSSFGQSQSVTMIQMAAAFSAIVNGGNYYQPHVVDEVISESGAVIRSNNKVLESKVITEKTSRQLRKDLYATVEEGTANPAKVRGYKVAGKTGTAEKAGRDHKNYLVSFMGCVPADDPELVVYVVIDEPNVEDQAHSTYATEFTSSLLKDVLPLLGIYPDKKLAKSQKDTASSSEDGQDSGKTSSKLKLPSTKNGNSILEAPDGGYVSGNYKTAGENADGNTNDTGISGTAAEPTATDASTDRATDNTEGDTADVTDDTANDTTGNTDDTAGTNE